jgi:hypothetical protein
VEDRAGNRTYDAAVTNTFMRGDGMTLDEIEKTLRRDES